MIVLFMVIVLLAGCTAGGGGAVHITADTAPASALEPPGLAEARALVVTASRAYKVAPPALMVGDHAGDATFSAVYAAGSSSSRRGPWPALRATRSSLTSWPTTSCGTSIPPCGRRRRRSTKPTSRPCGS